MNRTRHDKLNLLCTELEKHGFELWKEDDYKDSYNNPYIKPKRYKPCVLSDLMFYVMIAYERGDSIFISTTNDGTFYHDTSRDYKTIDDIIGYINRRYLYTINGSDSD